MQQLSSGRNKAFFFLPVRQHALHVKERALRAEELALGWRQRPLPLCRGPACLLPSLVTQKKAALSPGLSSRTHSPLKPQSFTNAPVNDPEYRKEVVHTKEKIHPLHTELHFLLSLIRDRKR